MFTLVYWVYGTKLEAKADTLDEILSIAVAAFDQNGQLTEIWEGDKMIMRFADIYEAIHRCYY